MLSLPITPKQLALLREAEAAVSQAAREYTFVFKAITAGHDDPPEGARFIGVDPETPALKFTLPPEVSSGESDS